MILTNVCLVRHAHSVYTTDELDRGLSKQGFKDAEKVSDLLSGLDADAIISSPYNRAIQTVQGIAKKNKKAIIINEDLRERLLSPEKTADFNRLIHKVWENPSFYVEGGESNEVAQRRGIAAFQTVLSNFHGGNIVIGTHGNIMTLIMNYFDAQYDFKFWQTLSMPNIYQLTFDQDQLINVHRIWGDREQS
ncbi:histidine phosphatase family protein [Cytobacillus purgationiresistens]|uniref:2,3-bisphosphoglycerate-dependent phosphoglycerate mutase n=1 Tax=Cytobacillus purgationiresistens TaxID=863449 RepID=A0ABU0AAS6_9BACI|nr:histidine phosphatase family protein [Cytobacillus purgationiresistens]MDQ0268352.1 2,3-bisphosphoglycerate-dependent phosphoglycerate mutase [Cytobacillus purgationiresistens]